jgi:hypothetical protein
MEKECDAIYLILELGVTMFPAVFFIFAGLMYFNEIRSIGFNRVVQYSQLFKWKYRACLLMAFINVMSIILSVAKSNQYIELNDCYDMDHDADAEKELVVDITIISKNVIYVVGWLGSYYLLIYQYRKGLSETWYSHQMFWILNFVAQITLLIYSWIKGFYGTTPIVMGVANVMTNFVLIVLLINTKKRTMDRPRPADIQFTADGSLVEQMENG